MKRSAAEIADQVARLTRARAGMMPDRRVLGEIDVQIQFLQDGSWTAKTWEEVLAREEAERWINRTSDTEPAAFWENLAGMWKQACAARAR